MSAPSALHVGDYGYYLNDLGEEVPVYICCYVPNSTYFYVADRYHHCHAVKADKFTYKGHLMNDLYLAHDNNFASCEPLTSCGMLYTVRLGHERFSSANIDDIYQVIFNAMLPKLEALKQRFFHHIDDCLFNGYVRLVPSSKPSNFFDPSFNYPIINGALFNTADEVEYDTITSVASLNERESDNGTGRQWMFVCSLDEGLKAAHAQQKTEEAACDCDEHGYGFCGHVCGDCK